MVELSLVIPSYNSKSALEKNIGYLVDSLKNSQISYEIIIVDDGSDANESVKEISEAYNFHYIRHDENLGKGSSLRTGFKYAQGEYILFTDSDIPYSFSNLIHMHQKIKSEDIDFVIGNRMDEKSSYFGPVPIKRAFFSHLYRIILTPLFGEPIDSQCGLKLFKKVYGKNLFANTIINRFSIDAELLILAKKIKLKYAQVPVQLRSQDGRSVKVFRDGPQMLFDLFYLYYLRFFKKFSE